MNDMTIAESGLAKLRQPFQPHQISKLPKPYKKDSPKGDCKVCGGYHGLPATHLEYVGHAALTDRLLDCDPAWNWEPVAFGPDGRPAVDGNGGMWIRLTVCGVTRLGYGHPDGKTGGDAIKETIGDALRNAAMRFGAALDLWHKGQLHVDEPSGPSDAEIAHDRALTNVLVNIEAATDLDSLSRFWKSLPRELQSEPKAIEAKDKRKAELNTPVETDEIPY